MLWNLTIFLKTKISTKILIYLFVPIAASFSIGNTQHGIGVNMVVVHILPKEVYENSAYAHNTIFCGSSATV